MFQEAMLASQPHARLEAGQPGPAWWPLPDSHCVVRPGRARIHTHVSCRGHGAGCGTPTPPSALHPFGRTVTQDWRQTQSFGNAKACSTAGDVPWARFSAYFWTGIKFHGGSWMPTGLEGNTVLCDESLPDGSRKHRRLPAGPGGWPGFWRAPLPGPGTEGTGKYPPGARKVLGAEHVSPSSAQSFPFPGGEKQGSER